MRVGQEMRGRERGKEKDRGNAHLISLNFSSASGEGFLSG